jgi:3,4-dihydroxy 2-butanone 4-phosphate synthase/GTP cyclohydrolase II
MKKQGPFDSIDAALEDILAGRPVIVTDDENRENEGDLVIAASRVTPENINMMIRHARGLICVPTTELFLRRLGLNPMVASNREQHKTDFTVSVDAAEGITTGISAADRFRTISILANPESTADLLVHPGHVFPLRARPGGVLERAGHTEAAVDLAVLAGLHPCGVICEILNEDGSCARLPELCEVRDRLGLKMISIAQLIEYRHQRERLVECVLKQPFESEFGLFELHVFRSRIDQRVNFALSMGQLDERPTLVRVHSENILQDLFAAKKSEGSGSLHRALQKIAEAGRGVVVYMTHPCGGLNVPMAPVSACQLEPIHMDFRGYGIGAQILSLLGLKKIKLLSSSHRRHIALEGYDLEIVDHLTEEAEG